MKTMTYSESRARYAEVLDQVVNDREEIIITRQGHESAVIMALDEYESLMETVYLMQSPANARHLRESIARHRLIYQISDDGKTLWIISCRYHYGQ